MRFVVLLITFLFVSFPMSCNKARFKGGESSSSPGVDEPVDPSKNSDKDGPKPGNGPSREHLFTASCQEGEDTNEVSVEFSASKNERIIGTLEGEFCPLTSARLNVVFVVDFSSSMGRHQKTSGGAFFDGNDPMINGTCGRYQAVQAILQSLQTQSESRANIQVAFMPFAGTALMDYSLSLRALSDFQMVANAERFCRFLTQSSSISTPGALYLPNGDPSTNYGAAFEGTKSLLGSNKSHTVMYFITDGEPTIPRQDPVGASKTAGDSFRKQVKSLTMNALILGSLPQAQDVLTKVAGSAQRVISVARAEELARNIVKFPEAKLDNNYHKGTFKVEPYPEKELGIETFGPGRQAGLWSFTTKSFVLLGTPGKVVDNVVTVEARGADGASYSSEMTIKYSQTE